MKLETTVRSFGATSGPIVGTSSVMLGVVGIGLVTVGAKSSRMYTQLRPLKSVTLPNIAHVMVGFSLVAGMHSQRIGLVIRFAH